MKHSTLSSFLLSALLVSPFTVADDTEIFINKTVTTDGLQPNILFIFDTSGSMGGTITTQEDYDPTHDYGGIGNDTIYEYKTNYSFTGKTIDPSRNNCKSMLDFMAAQQNGPTPVYLDRAAEWVPNSNKPHKSKWKKVTNSSRQVECKKDRGIHGENDTSTKKYARNGSNGPYSSSSSSSITWKGNGIANRLYVSANYHFYLQTVPAITRTKMDVMKEAAIDLVNEFEGLNFGLMRFNGSNGGYVKHHFSDVATDRTQIIANINALTASGFTPLVESLWEAHKYFSGDAPDFGTNSDRDPAAVSSGVYNSPMKSAKSCQNNYVVLLTDGEPYRDSARDTQISTLSGTPCKHVRDGAKLATETCLDEMAGYMVGHDYNSNLDGVQNVITYTVGFNIDMDLLEKTATAGKGEYHTVKTSQELKTAFTEIILSILSKSSTFTAPAVSVNQFNQLQHRNELYFSLFEPNIYPRWHGNLKKFKLNTSGDLVDANDVAAFDDTTGLFKSSAKSIWSDVVDGNVVQKGGAAGELSNSRNVVSLPPGTYTYPIDLATQGKTLKSDIPTTLTPPTPTPEYTLDSLGMPSTATEVDRSKFLAWASGADVDDEDVDGNITEKNHFMGDGLHSRPVVVTYAKTTDDSKEFLVSTTNDGTFRITAAKDGTEKYAFIPPELLPVQFSYYENDPDGNRYYGLDGAMTIWRKESAADTDLDIEADEGDHVYSYFGMRRGGSNYYAMDITDPSSPDVLWKITGGDSGFQDLAQTWSKPIKGTVKWGCDSNSENCATKDVLFFGGGYDETHDSTPKTTKDLGAAIYMVDANTGALLWSAGNNDDNITGDDVHKLNLPIKHSIASDLAVSDLNGDGLDDMIIGMDIMGHLWRIDINKKPKTANDFASGGMIANLTNSTEPRLFYNTPAVAISKPLGQLPYLVIAVGSGYTAHPRNKTINDRFYVLFEESVFGPKRDKDDNPVYTATVENDLLEVTSDVKANKLSNAPKGYYRDAGVTGEKFLRKPLIFNGGIFLTSYLPEGGTASTACGSNYLGTGRLYVSNFLTGENLLKVPYINLKQPGIAAEVIIVFNKNENGGTDPIVLSGAEKITLPYKDDKNCPTCLGMKTLYWRENK